MDNPGRRDPSQFEPPPWEKEQYDELTKRREEQAAKAAAEAEAAKEAAAAAEAQAAPAETASPGVGPGKPDAGSQGSVPGSKPEDAVDGVDPAVMKEMMERLKIEEPEAKSFWRVRLVVAAFIGVGGAILMIWGMVAFRASSSNQTGVLAAVILLLFGFGFIALAAWTAYRGLQQRGVI